MPRGDSPRRSARAQRSPRAKGRAVAASRAARRLSAPLAIVILAAGEGKRMKSARPKVLQPLAGRALLQHVIDTARALRPAAIHVVYGYGGEEVRPRLGGEPVCWTLQA